MSALTNLPGFIAMQRDMILSTDSNVPAFTTAQLIDASAEKAAFLGEVWHPTVKTGTINIRKVHFRCGAIAVTWLTSVVRCSLQNVSLTAGPPYQPDGTQDQTFDFNNGAQLTANAWNTTGNLSADRAVDLSADSIGDANSRWLAVVLEYATFTVLDSLILNGVNAAPGGIAMGTHLGAAPLLQTAAWAAQANGYGNVVLECDDGTFAFLNNCTAFSALGTASVASNGAIRRAGVIFQVPMQLKVSKMSLFGLIPNACDGTLTLYDSDGTSVLASVDVDNDPVRASGTPGYMDAEFPPVTLTAATDYRFVFVATTTTAATIYYGDVNAVGHMDGLLLGQNARWTQHDGTNWAETTTRRPHFGIGISAVHDGAGGGSSLPAVGFAG